MPAALIQYRLTIRNASTLANPNGTADELVVTSIATGTNPFIAQAPSGDGQEVDPITGAVRTGAYTVQIVDANTGTDATGTIRVVTNKLEDASFRQQLVSRRAYLEVRTDAGAWSMLVAGYVAGVRLVSPMRYEITVGDSRRVEQTQTIYQGGALGGFTTRGCLTGGPVTATWGPVKARGGWRYRLAVNGNDVSAEFVDGYEPGRDAPVVKDWRKLTNPAIPSAIEARRQVNPFAIGGGSDFVTSYTTPQYDATLTDWVVAGGVVAWVGTTATNAAPVRALVVGPAVSPANESLGVSHVYLYWPGCPFSTGQVVYLSLSTLETTEQTPLYLDAHPVDIVTTIWTNARIAYNPAAAWLTSIRDLIGANVRLACRFTAPPKIAEFLEKAIYGPFGIAARTNAAGEQELFATRIRTATTPALTLDTNSLTSAEPLVFDLDEQTAVSAVTLRQQVFNPAPYVAATTAGNGDTQATQSRVPQDGVLVSQIEQTAQYLDPNLTVFTGRNVTYDVPGMVHTATNWEPATTAQLDAISLTMFDRFGRGCQASEADVLSGSSAAAAQVGDELYYDVAHFPNKGYRIGESTVGPRIMQVVRRTETPTGPKFRLLDSGLAAQPATAATITIAQNASAPASIAQYTITNAATLNATGVISVEVEWAVSPTQPTGGQSLSHPAGEIPTGAVNLPAVNTPGATVWVRARSEQAGRRPSAWSGWASVALAAVAAPSGLTTSNLRQTAVTLSWTNTSSTLPLAVYAYQGASAPASWVPYRVGTLPVGSTSTVVRSLTGPSIAWTVGVAYDTPNGTGAVAAATVTTNNTLDTATRPAALAVIPGVDDATLTQGIALALWPSDPTLDIVIERSTTSGAGFTEVARVSGATAVYVDERPRDGVTYYYRIAHLLGGFGLTTYTPEVSATARGVPAGVLRPSAVVPVVQVETTESGSTGTVTLTITDPQGRVNEVRFRERTGGGAWSAWTVDSTVPYTYSGTIPASGFLDIQYEVNGFRADGTLGLLAAGTESFDVGTSADMVSVVGTFNAAGAFVLAISADSDTASIKYATSTVSQPTLATTQAQTAVNGRNITATLAGPFASSSTVFVSVLGYTGINGTGTESVLFQYRFTRDGGLVYTECLATAGASSATQIVVTVTGTAPSGSPTVQLVAITGSATLASGAAIGVPVASGSSWTFNRGEALGQPGGAQFRSVLAGAQSDDDFIEIPEQGRDTTYLASRARVITTTETTVTVRYAVLDKYSPLSTTITYLTQGIATLSPGTPQTVTAAIGTTYTVPEEVAGSYVDYTITRPLTGLPTGRVTFTASATGRVSDSDAVDVPAQDIGMMAVSAAFNAAGAATLSFVGDSSVASFKFAISTSAFPTLATVQATTAINGRNSTQTLAGPYALGTSLFVSCVTYTGASGTGKESPIFQYQFVRQNTAPTVLNRQPATQVCDPTSSTTGWSRQLGYYVPGFVPGPLENAQGEHFGQVIVPRGVTLRAVRVNCYALQPPSGGGSGDILTVNFYRATSNGGSTFLGSTQQNIYAGWQTLAVTSLSEDTTDRSYFVRIYANWNLPSGGGSDLRVAWIESEYDKTTTDQNI